MNNLTSSQKVQRHRDGGGGRCRSSSGEPPLGVHLDHREPSSMSFVQS